MTNNKILIKFPKSKKIERDWGHEELLVVSSKKYTMKKLFIRKGMKGGLQYHMLKDEAVYVMKGKLLVRFEDTNGKIKNKILKSGDFVHFPNKSIHQEEAIEDTYLIECSTPHANDRVRVDSSEDQEKFGLQTTKFEEVKIL